MARGNDVSIRLDLDDRKARDGIKKLAKEVGNLDDDLEDAQTAGKRLAAAIEQSAADMISEIDATALAVAAMERQLDGTDFDSRQVVADLKKIGLTAEDIENDAEALARALQKADDVKIHAAEAGFKDLSQAVGDVEGDIGRTGDTMTGFVGGAVGELPLIGEQMGPLSEGLGQLTEGAISGEVAVKGLVAAGLGMGALTLALQGITGHFEAQKAIDAFNRQTVDDYTSALKGADSTLAGINDKLRDAEGVQINVFGDEMDVTQSIVEAGLDMETFAVLLEQGEERWREWSEAAEAAGVDGDAIRGTLLALSSESEALEKATEAAAITNAFLGDTLDDTEASAQGLVDTTQDEAEALGDLAYEASDAASEVGELEAAFADLRGEMDDRSAYLSIGDSFDTLKQKGADALEAAASGAEDADAKMRDFERAQMDLTDRVIDYATEVGNIPPETVSEILALIDEGSIDAAQDRLDGLERARTASVSVNLSKGSGWGNAMSQHIALDRGGLSPNNAVALNAERRPEIYNGQLVTEPSIALGPGTVTSVQTTAAMLGRGGNVTNVTNIYAPPGLTSRDLADTAARTRRRNGRL